MSTKFPTPRRRGVASVAAAVSVALPAAMVLGSVAQSATAAPLPATPNVGVLAGALAQQTITWETCDFGSDVLNQRFNQPNVKCATVKVPRDWHNPSNGLTWDIRISQAKNQDVKSGRYKGTVFANPGGPGGSGLPWGPAMQERTPDMNPYFNYVGFDPRGVGQSSHAVCDYEYDPQGGAYAQLKAYGTTCSQNADVKTITTEQTVYDMDFIRYLLKAPKLSYVGYSYGTWLGAWYEKIFGAKYGDKFVLDSAIDATQPTLESTWNLQPVARDRQFQMHMMNWIARHDDEFLLGTDPVDIYKRYFAASEYVGQFITVLYWVVLGGAAAFAQNEHYPDAGNVVGTLIKFYEAFEPAKGSVDFKNGDPAKAANALFTAAAANAKGAEKAKILAAQKKLSGLFKLSTTAKQSAKAAAEGDMMQASSEEVFDFIRCNDGQFTQGSAYWENFNAKLAKKAPLTNSWGLLEVPVCAFWRTNNLMPVAKPGAFPRTIVVQGELDSQTGWEGGYASGIKLPNTSFIAIDNEGSHGHFPYGTETVDRPIYNFFLNGKTAPNITVGQALPLPWETVTYETWAKLNKQAKHVPINPGPWTPAVTGTKIGASQAGDDLLANSEVKTMLTQQVRKYYGEAGVKALEKSGVL